MYAANYYVPVQRVDETQPSTKKQLHSVSKPSHAARILGRRYALTASSFKYLEIAISVGSVSTVEIILGDNRGTQLIFPYATWTTLIEQRADIQRLLDTSSYSPLWIRDMAVQICTFNNLNVFKLSLTDRYLYLQPSTLDSMFEFEHCIDHMYVYLTKHIDTVNRRVPYYTNILRKNNISDLYNAKKAIRECDVFDCESLIDCELLACAIPDIMYIANN